MSAKDIDRNAFNDRVRKELHTVPSEVLPKPVSFNKPTVDGIDSPTACDFRKRINDHQTKRAADKAFVRDKAAERRD